jgi:capsular polysaccharide transport system permease protein
MRTSISNDDKGQSSGFRETINVMHAVILRDIRSRFFNHGLGFLIVPLLPLAHVALLLTIYHISNREVVFGDDMQLFFATGLAPALGFNYLSRFMSVSLLANKSMTAFPVVRVLDIMLARAFLEFMGMNLAILVLVIALTVSGSNIFPHDPAAALLAYVVTMIMGVGVGIIISVFAAIWPMFALLWALFTALLYISSDGPIYLHAFPREVLYAASWNPVFHAVQWVRSAYYQGYPTDYLDKTYLIGWAFASVAVGLSLERLLKGQILKN